MSKPLWLISQLRDRNVCEQCAERTAATEWAGTGELLCWPCCEARQDAYHARQDS
jgi:formylmethanofuran dehydrogenase subunit E